MENRNWVPYPRYIFRKELALSLIQKYVSHPSRFLEVGCAAGDMGITLAKRGYTGLMIDYSEEAEKQAKKYLRQEGITEVRFEKQDFTQIDRTEEFDLILMFEVLEHIENDLEALRQASTLLHENGLLLFSVPAKQKLWGPSDLIVGHLRRYEKSRLVTMTNEAGFEILQLFSYGFPWLNIIKYVRDSLARKAVKKGRSSDKLTDTQQSGLNPESIRAPVFERFFTRNLLWPFMKISNLFNSFDQAEGYLCMARKYTTSP